MIQSNKNLTPQGFTIVELLIVVVIIGILAAITLVSYNGIQNRSKNSAALALANGVSKKVTAYYTVEQTYPGTAAAFTSQTAVPEAVLDNPASVNGNAPTTTDGTSRVQYDPCQALDGMGSPTGPVLGVRIVYQQYPSGTASFLVGQSAATC